ncbi:HNH endonuclease [Acinetobacter pittii]|uniref:HNH endonuclease n=1 Tax=Acinetobacter pittii TaxID=48296 RepID=UPI000A3D2983|nr:HNH endonuclease [Acinetobacter pittii]OTU34782.1 HNH endonuclease [Acinetobacter pittii]
MSNRPPQRAKRPCLVGSCKDFASYKGYCDQHQDRIKKKDRERGTAHQRGYDARWEKDRTKFLDENPLCADHRKRGMVEAATVVDHIIPHKGDQVLFWDKNNWQPLCKSCHDRKTATEDKGSWSPVQSPSKANRESKNEFNTGDFVCAATGYAIDSLDCKFTDQFMVTAVAANMVEVSDADGFVHRLHHSHFKAVTV